MKAKRTIAIQLHETDTYPAIKGHFVWALREQWEQSGIQVNVLKGCGANGDADLLIPHVTLSVVPQPYLDMYARFPRVINRGLLDISKRTISRNLLTAGDPYDGPVIVKTNLNYGGIPEAILENRRATQPSRKRRGAWVAFKRWLRSKPPDWRNIKQMETDGYKVFRCLKKVPEAVFANDGLVVERFLPEIENGIYHLRVYVFFGDRGYSVRVGSTHPIVKQKNIVSREDVPVPDELLAMRRERELDYGKMDYVIREGRVVLFDINRTPGLTHPEERMKARAARLAPGIESFF